MLCRPEASFNPPVTCRQLRSLKRARNLPETEVRRRVAVRVLYVVHATSAMLNVLDMSEVVQQSSVLQY